MWILIPIGIVLVLMAVILIRTLRFTPKAADAVTVESIDLDRERAIHNLQELVRCKTISYMDPKLEDKAEFDELIDRLPKLYPNVFATCRYERLEDKALLFCWKGKSEGEPLVLMAHFDVVPVEEDGWDKPPFSAVIEDGRMWGRGTLDTKVTVNAILSAAEHLIAAGFEPEQDIYFAFSGQEESNGPAAAHIVDWFEKQSITPSMVLDEGGAVVEQVFPGVDAPCAMIGIAEKGYLNVWYRVRSAGGHASAPTPCGPVEQLMAACARVVRKPFPYRMTVPAAKMFDTLGRHSSFLYRMIFANLWLFSPVLDGICRAAGGDLNALLRTTVAFTQMQGSAAANVIPPTAQMVSNIRINPAESVESVMAQLRRRVADDGVEVEAFDAMEPSRISTVDCDGFEKLSESVREVWNRCIVAPYLMVQCSDSRHYGRISDRVYRFSAMDLTDEERASIHGHNEHIRLDTVCRAVEFYIRLMRRF